MKRQKTPTGRKTTAPIKDIMATKTMMAIRRTKIIKKKIIKRINKTIRPIKTPIMVTIKPFKAFIWVYAGGFA